MRLRFRILNETINEAIELMSENCIRKVIFCRLFVNYKFFTFVISFPFPVLTDSLHKTCPKCTLFSHVLSQAIECTFIGVSNNYQTSS